MATVRRTISLPPAVARRLDQEAKRRRLSFSGLIAEIASADVADLPYAGTIDDDPDLSLLIEEVLARRDA